MASQSKIHGPTKSQLHDRFQVRVQPQPRGRVQVHPGVGTVGSGGKKGEEVKGGSPGEGVCVVCCQDMNVVAMGSCDHPVCLACSVKMRVLCGQPYCAVCRLHLDKVFITRTPTPFVSLDPRTGISETEYGFSFCDGDLYAKFKALLSHTCPLCPKLQPFDTLGQLQAHMRRVHDLHACDLCLKHLKIFTHERRWYSRQDLAQHRRSGDTQDRSHRGHPLCQFCSVRFLDNDELLRHLRQNHYYCHFCDADGSNEYYSDYESLKDHFRRAHFLCEEGECAHEQFTHAFRSEIDLRAHRATVHSRNRAEARHTRQLELAFSYPSRHVRCPDGVVIGADYQEVTGNDRIRGTNRFSRGREQRTNLDEAQELQLALHISEDCGEESGQHGENGCVDVNIEGKKREAGGEKGTSSGETVAKKAALGTNSGTTNQPAHLEDKDFPTLRETLGRPEVVSGSSSTSTKKVTSGADGHFPKARSFEEDFPSLQANSNVTFHTRTCSWKPSNVPRTQGATQSAVQPKDCLTLTTILHPKAPTPAVARPGPTNSKTAPTASKTAQPSFAAEDFPALSRSSCRGAATPTTSAWCGGAAVKLSSAATISKASAKFSAAKVPIQPSLAIRPDGIAKNDAGLKASALGKELVEKERLRIPKNQGTMDPLESSSSCSTKNDASSNAAQEMWSRKPGKKKKKKGAGLAEVGNGLAKVDAPSKESEIMSVTEVKLKEDKTRDTKITKDEKKTKREQIHVENEDKKGQKHKKSENGDDAPLEEEPSKWTETKGKKGKGKNKVKGVARGEPESATSADGKVDGEENLESKTEKRGLTAPVLANGHVDGLANGLTALQLKRSSTCPPPPPPGLRKPDVPGISLEDFPVLRNPRALAKPPPGFMQPWGPFERRPPDWLRQPGLQHVPPPGLVRSVQSERENIPPSSITPPLVRGPYLQPENFSERNQALIKAIRACLLDDKDRFNEFRRISGLFRQGTTSAEAYYQQCRDLLGNSSFPSIFPELLILLPDLGKQCELLSVHGVWMETHESCRTTKPVSKGSRRAKRSVRASDDVEKTEKPLPGCSICQRCGQVLGREDVTWHAERHMDTDFPQLGHA